MIRILYIASYYKPAYVYGGPVRSSSALCEALVAAGADLTVLTTNAGGEKHLDVPLGQRVQVDGVGVYYYPVADPALGRFFYSPELATACVGQIPQADLVVLDAHWGHAMGVAAPACMRLGVPYVIPLRGQIMPWSLRQKRWKKGAYLALFGRRYLNGAAALHCTDTLEAEAATALGLAPPVFVVPNGVDLSRFSNLPQRGGLRGEHGLTIPESATVLLCLGRLHRTKRPDIAIAAAAAAQSLGEAHLVVAGPDEERLIPRLRSQAQDLGCGDRVHFVGMLEGEDVLPAFVDSDLLLMPSEVQESFGRSALEALAAGVPILVSNGIPVGRWAEAAGAGRRVASSPEAFARATCELLADPGLLRAMGQRGRELVRDRFDITVVTRQMLAHFQAIVSTGRPLPE